VKVLEFSGGEREDLPYRKYCMCIFRDTMRGSVSKGTAPSPTNSGQAAVAKPQQTAFRVFPLFLLSFP
jgi:hypothetical protein